MVNSIRYSLQTLHDDLDLFLTAMLCRTVFYGQYQCSGPGADFGRRVSLSRELTQQEAKPFISIGFVDGYEWLTNL